MNALVSVPYAHSVYDNPRRSDQRPIEHPIIAQVFKVLETHLSDENFSVRDLADALCMDRSTLYRNIKAQTGFSIKEIILRYRLKRACELLEDSHMKILEIAIETGFISHTRLTQAFTYAYGCSPQQWRKTYQSRFWIVDDLQ